MKPPSGSSGEEPHRTAGVDAPTGRPVERRASAFVLRPFEETDRSACLALFDSNVPRCFQASERSELEAFLDAPPGPYFILERNGDVVGCDGYAIAAEGRRADLCWGMIRQDHQGRGLGKHLTDSRIDNVLSHPGVEEVVLRTIQSTTGFYRSLGFEIAAVEPDGFGPGLDRCEMRLGASSWRSRAAAGRPAGGTGLRRDGPPPG